MSISVRSLIAAISILGLLAGCAEPLDPEEQAAADYWKSVRASSYEIGDMHTVPRTSLKWENELDQTLAYCLDRYGVDWYGIAQGISTEHWRGVEINARTKTPMPIWYDVEIRHFAVYPTEEEIPSLILTATPYSTVLLDGRRYFLIADFDSPYVHPVRQIIDALIDGKTPC